MAKKKPIPAAKLADPFKYRASQFRSNWRQRAIKNGWSGDDVPTTAEINTWLRQWFIVDTRDPTKSVGEDFYDGKELSILDFQADHKIPLERGGSPALGNMCITSKRNNMLKGGLTAGEFCDLMEFLDNIDQTYRRKFEARLLMAGNNFKRR